ncbi:tRNA lysidine(34) synthetase TilS [bacterium]|nr:tRNA lysidine(34) synthetase TilS [bacterium]
MTDGNLQSQTELVPVTVIKTIAETKMFSPGDKVLIAYSGGPDSTALVHILMRHRDRYRISLDLCYLNHNLRGDQSDFEQKFVERAASALGLPLHVKVLSENEASEIARGSIEARARAHRLSFLKDTAAAISADKIATGHTSDDQVETLLMRLFIGTGPDGFRGIEPISSRLVRPLINTPKSELLAFLDCNGIDYVQDSTNLQTRFLRNRVRHQLVPRIVEIFGDHALRKICALSKIVQDESKIVSKLAWEAYQEARQDSSEPLSLNVENLDRLKPALLRRVLRLALSESGYDNQTIRANHLGLLQSVLKSSKSEPSVLLPGGIRVLRRNGLMLFDASAEVSHALPFCVELPVPGEASVADRSLRITAQIVEEPSRLLPISEEGALIDMDSCLGQGNALILRSASPGDAFAPLGMTEKVGVSSFLKKAKIPSSARKHYPLLCSQSGQVLWIIGMRIDHSARVTTSSQRGVLLLTQSVPKS